MSLGALLRSARKRERWTQAQIASRMNTYYDTDVYDQSRVSYWERDQREAPSPEDLRMLSSVYGIDIVDVVVAAGYLTRDEVEVRLRDVSDLPPEMAEFQDIGRAVDDVRRRLAALQERLDAQDRHGRESSQSAGR